VILTKMNVNYSVVDVGLFYLELTENKEVMKE